MLYYCPLESYKERYTMQWSAPITGWLERNWIKNNTPYQRIDGYQSRPSSIKTGCVLDAVTRSMFCFSQIEQLLILAEEGKITNQDIIYFDDFWHPGIEALPYAFHMFKIKPKMFAFLHAQSVDEFDFTYPMRHWMRFFEKGIAATLDGIFVCGPCLRDLVVFGGIAPKEKVYITGHPFCSQEVRERMPSTNSFIISRKPHVIFCSRWDSEKNPQFFIEVAKRVIRNKPNAHFIICTSSEHIRSNDINNIEILRDAILEYPNQIILKENLSKEEYYIELCQAKIQMNTANQDFVAITLLEASVAGCYPVYPYFRSFPETFRYDPQYMYKHLDLNDAVQKVLYILNRDDLWTAEEITNRAWIHTRFDSSWRRMLQVMKGQPIDNPYLINEKEDR